MPQGSHAKPPKNLQGDCGLKPLEQEFLFVHDPDMDAGRIQVIAESMYTNTL